MTALHDHNPRHFRQKGIEAIENPESIGILPLVGLGLRTKLAQEKERYPQYDNARDLAARIKEHTLNHLDYYLEQFELKVRKSGGHVHYARDAAEARKIVLQLCEQADAKIVTRSKSMLGEEIGLPDALDGSPYERIETDLGEHIIQLKGDPPSHIVGPAMHMSMDEIRELFRVRDAADKGEEEPGELVRTARDYLRDKFLNADVGISGANFLIADTGTVVTVTNEGNAELTTQVPRVHIVTAGIEKLVPTRAHAGVFLRLLARSALGIDITQYTSFFTGPKRDGDLDGPEEFHVVLVDNKRTEMLGSALRPILRCIRCGACLNSCPVYEQVGGHAYGFAYQGPMGSVLTPTMTSLEEAGDLPQACTLNGRCEEVCPVKIPLPDLMREMRTQVHRAEQDSWLTRTGFKIWNYVVVRPKLYRLATRLGLQVLARGARSRAFQNLPGLKGWTKVRALPSTDGETFMDRYKKGER